jgi:hypothetical protein
MTSVHLKVSAQGTIIETWKVPVPEGSLLLSDDELKAVAFQNINAEGAQFVSQTTEDEHDREPLEIYRPAENGVARVTWKDEDEVGGQPVGPCHVYREGEQVGVHEGGWITLAEARKVAAEHGVELEVA